MPPKVQTDAEILADLKKAGIGSLNELIQKGLQEQQKQAKNPNGPDPLWYCMSGPKFNFIHGGGD